MKNNVLLFHFVLLQCLETGEAWITSPYSRSLGRFSSTLAPPVSTTCLYASTTGTANQTTSNETSTSSIATTTATTPTTEPPPSLPPRIRRTLQLDHKKEARIVSRTVSITPDWPITVWEWEKPAAVVETFWAVQNQGLTLTSSSAAVSPFQRTQNKDRVLDPFGLVSWPGSVVAARELSEHPHVVRDRHVLIVGAGVGVEAQACAQLGAKSVLATDIHPTTLKLLQYGAQQAGLDNIIRTQLFDLFSADELPPCEVLVVADVLYNERLAYQIAWRVAEARKLFGAMVLVSDSQRFVDHFESDMARRLIDLPQRQQQQQQQNPLWEPRELSNFTGSGVLINEDQTYNVKARIMWLGLKHYVPRPWNDNDNNEANNNKQSSSSRGRQLEPKMLVKVKDANHHPHTTTSANETNITNSTVVEETNEKHSS